MNRRPKQIVPSCCLFPCILCAIATVTRAAPPNPVLNSVFPAGGQIGQQIELTIAGGGFVKPTLLDCSATRLTFERLKDNQFRVTIPKETRPGLYDLRVVCNNGLSSPRMFFIGNRPEQLETEPNDDLQAVKSVPLNGVINGRIEKGGDLDHFRFTAMKGQRVVIECWAERIDSKLRAVLEVYDASGRRLAVNRGYFGIDPLIDFHVPTDGDYVVKVHDLIFSGSADHFYRLDIDTGPRVAFAVPNVIQRGTTSRVTLFGWNLNNDPGSQAPLGNPPQRSSASRGVERASNSTPSVTLRAQQNNFDTVTVEITAPNNLDSFPTSVRLQPAQVAIDGFAYHYPNSHAPIVIGITDVPVHSNASKNHTATSALDIAFPCEVSGQLIAGDEQDWFAIQARRGEVLWIEAFGERIGSPVDLDVSVLDAVGKNELAHFSDEVQNIGGQQFPSSHLDPSGRWVVPADGRYLVMIRNLIGDLDNDPRRQYRLSIRRQEPDFQLAVVAHRGDPAALNVSRGGRTIVDVLAFRRRGLTGPIRVSPTDLPAGIECPDVWFGPNVTRVPLVVSASNNAETLIGALKLQGHAASAGSRKVRAATMVRTGLPNGWGRMTDTVALSVSGEAPLKITANGHEHKIHNLYGDLEARHSPGTVVDIAIEVERTRSEHQADVQLIGVGLPPSIRNQTATIPSGNNKGHVSFYLPPTIPLGKYTIAVQGTTSVATGPKGKDGKQKTEGVTVFSNPVTINVEPAAFVVEVDPYNPRKIRRGEIVQVKYTCRRVNGFINKIHTELAAPEKVIGIRGRGVTFVGQTESGTVQVIASDNAPFGQQPFLRLYAVGVVEDEPVFRGSCFLNLEVVE